MTPTRERCLLPPSPAPSALDRKADRQLVQMGPKAGTYSGGDARAIHESPHFAAIVAEVEDELVGSGGISIYEVPPGKRAEAAEGYVMSMYTMPAHRGRGVALAILDGLIDFCAVVRGRSGMAADVDDGPPRLRAGRLPGLRPVHASGSDRQVTASF